MPEQNWTAYLRETNGHPTSVLMDLGYGRGASDPARPLCIDLGISLKTNYGNGFPEKAELQAIDSMDGAAIAALAAGIDALHVGTYMCKGERHWVFYAPQGQHEAAIRSAAAAFTGYQPRYTAKPDAAWRVYNETLYPTYAEERKKWDMRVVMALEQAGDRPDRPRQIDHLAYFASADAARGFAAWCGQNDFVVTNQTETPGHEHPYAVHFNHHGPATPEAVSERTVLADEMARRMGGQYDGWGTHAQKGRWWRLGR